jgi:hypothetical protein
LPLPIILCALLPESFWRLAKTPLEGAAKTGMVFIANVVRHLLDFHIGGHEQVGGCCEPPFTKEIAELHSSLLLEQALKMSWAQMYLLG